MSAGRVAELRANADRWANGSYAEANLKVSDRTARINVTGVLLNNATAIDEMYASWFGEDYSTYPGLIAQIKAAEANPNVDTLEFFFDTPGGIVAGLDEASQIVAKCGKPTKALVGWMCASAGYYLASQCGSIEASNRSSSVGSIGTLVSLMDATKMYEKIGISFYTISSSNAPNKAPEQHSDEYKAEIQKRVDYLGALFAERVAEGRSKATGNPISKDDVEKDFGRGGLVFANAALAAGMIDAVEETSSNRKEDMMGEVDKGASAEAIATAMQQGVKQERARVSSLLPFMAADSDRVMKAITDGEELGSALFSELHEAGLAKAEASAVTRHEASEQARIAAEAVARESDVAPELATKDDEVPVAEDADDALMAQATKKSQIKPKTAGGK